MRRRDRSIERLRSEARKCSRGSSFSTQDRRDADRLDLLTHTQPHRHKRTTGRGRDAAMLTERVRAGGRRSIAHAARAHQARRTLRRRRPLHRGRHSSRGDALRRPLLLLHAPQPPPTPLPSLYPNLPNSRPGDHAEAPHNSLPIESPFPAR